MPHSTSFYTRIHFFYFLLITAGIYTIFPFFIIAKYNHPSADDFYIGITSKNDLFYNLKETYNNWSGRYFATFISQFHPLKYNAYGLYKIYPVVLLIAFVIALFLLIKEVFGKYFSNRKIVACTCFFIILYFIRIPSTAEAFYWFPASSIYQLANIIFLLLIYFLFRLKRSFKTTSKIIYFISSIICCICIIGSNEISLLITTAFIWITTIYLFRFKQETRFYLLLLSVICLLAALTEISAPGNFKRLNDFQKFSASFILSITGGVSVSVYYLFAWMMNVLIATLVYIPFIGVPFAERKKGKNRLPFSWLHLLIVFIALQVFAIWAAGGSNLPRIENILYLFFPVRIFWLSSIFS